MTKTNLIEQFPHCDARILHAPGECDVCDRHPEWQELREWWGINFTGHHDPEKVPCPVEMFRTFENANKWPGNHADVGPTPAEDPGWMRALRIFQNFFKEQRELEVMRKERMELTQKIERIESRRKQEYDHEG